MLETDYKKCYNSNYYFINMKNIIILICVLFIVVQPSFSYTESQLKECVDSARKNPSTQGKSELSINNYCQCALKSIIDEKNDISESGYFCAKKTFAN